MNVIKWVKGFFSGYIKAFRAFLDLAIPVARQIIIGQMKDFVLDTISDLSKSTLDNNAKREEALKRIRQEAINRGMNLKESLINAMVELGVLTFKKDF